MRKWTRETTGQPQRLNREHFHRARVLVHDRSTLQDLLDGFVAVTASGLSRNVAAAWFGVSVLSAIRWHRLDREHGRAVARKPGGDCPLHTDFIFVAQCRLRLLRQADTAPVQARRVTFFLRSSGRHRPLHPRIQCRQTEALHLACRSRQHYRCSRPWVPNVGFNPLVSLSGRRYAASMNGLYNTETTTTSGLRQFGREWTEQMGETA